MKTPENNSNKRPRKNSKQSSSMTTPQPETQSPVTPPKMIADGTQLIEADATMMKELLEKANNTIKSQKIKRYINDQKDAEAIRSIIQEFFTSFILVGYSVDNKRLIVKSTNSDKDEDALLEELRYVCYKLSGGG